MPPDAVRLRLSGQASILRLIGHMVGTVTYYPQAPSDSLHPASYKTSVGYFGQLAVSRSAQGSGLGARLLDWIEQKATQDGKQEIATRATWCVSNRTPVPGGL
jgi:GNAT superfamily N-acetyltransferase